METMSKTIFNLFKNYYYQLVRLDEVKADRNDLIAMDEAAVRSMFTQKVPTRQNCSHIICTVFMRI